MIGTQAAHCAGMHAQYLPEFDCLMHRERSATRIAQRICCWYNDIGSLARGITSVITGITNRRKGAGITNRRKGEREKTNLKVFSPTPLLL
jgi:hypothetical protein